jgi:hypothetical protein
MHKMKFRRTGSSILRLALLILLIYSVLAGLYLITFGGFMDFPCPAIYVEEDDCVSLQTASIEKPENMTQIEIFLTSYEAGFKGGGCNHQVTDANTMDVQTSVRDLSFEINGSSFRVNGKVLEKGAKFQATNIFHWNPWIISRLQFENHGLIPDCQSHSEHQRLVIIGSYGTEISLLKGSLISSALLAGLIMSILRTKKPKIHPSP